MQGLSNFKSDTLFGNEYLTYESATVFYVGCAKPGLHRFHAGYRAVLLWLPAGTNANTL